MKTNALKASWLFIMLVSSVPAAQSLTLGGRVTTCLLDRNGLCTTGIYVGVHGVTISITGYNGLKNVAVNATLTTDTNGNYSVTTLQSPFSVTVTPGQDCTNFAPANLVYSGQTADVTTANFTSNPFQPVIAGKVTDSNGVGVSGIVMNGLPGNPVTNSAGNYSVAVSCSFSGTVTPTNSCYSFPSKTYSAVKADMLAENYSGSIYVYRISGFVRTMIGAAVPGVAMAGFPGTGTIVTALDGSYGANVFCGWAGTVSPQKTGFSFTPPSVDYSKVPIYGDRADYYTAACVYSLSPVSANVPPSQGSKTFSVNTGSGCDWTPGSNAAWITVLKLDPQTVQYSYAGNPTKVSRTGTMAVAGQTFTLAQAGDVTAPNLTITSPASNSTTTTSPSLNISGQASDDVGVASVSWTNDRGGSGTANLTLSGLWNVYGVALQAGVNNITLTASDLAENTRSAAIAVTYTPLAAFTVGTSPSGLSIAVDGASYISPMCFWWLPGSTHTIATTSPQGGGSSRQVFSIWNDSGAISHNVTAPSVSTTYTATFGAQYKLSATVTPSGSGSIAASPSSSDGFYNSGSSVQLTATANPGFAFSGWSGDLTGTQNPATLPIPAPRAIAATFVCAYSLTPASRIHGAGADTGTISVSGGSGCNWTAANNSSWITVASGASGSGAGTVGYSITANTDASSRSGTLTVAGQTFTVTQAGVSPPANVSVTINTVPSNLNLIVDNVTYGTAQIFSWAPGSNHSIATVSPQGSGGARQVFAGWSDGGGMSHNITIPSVAATYSATFSTQYQLTTSVTPAAGGSVEVSPGSADGFYNSGASLQLTATANTGFTFSGWGGDLTGSANPAAVIMSGLRNVIASFSACSYDVSPVSATIKSGGGIFAIDVRSGPGCAWTASSDSSWINMTSGSGTGIGQALFSVAKNDSPQSRNGTLTVAGKSVQITEEGVTCIFTLNPTSRLHGSGSENGRVDVSASSPYCSWTASSNSSWISILRGDSATGNGTVVYELQLNPQSTSRSGTLTIAGLPFPVTQAQGAVPAIATLNPASVNAGGADINLILEGGNFVSGTMVRWNGQDRPTLFIGVTQLKVKISASDILSPGKAQLTAVNPGGFSSNPCSFTILDPVNPIPAIDGIVPSTIPASTQFLTPLHVFGKNFSALSRVRWNGSDRPTQFLDSQRLYAILSFEDIAAQQKARVSVFNPAPGGGESSIPFEVIAGPAITTISPYLLRSAGNRVKLTVFGAGLGLPVKSASTGSQEGATFVEGPQAGTVTVLCNGQPLETQISDTDRLVATVPAGLLTTEGNATIAVQTPEGSTNAVSVPVTSSNPLPYLKKLDPGDALPKGGPLTVTVEGLNFTEGSQVMWNGSARTTEFVDSTTLRVTIPASDLASVGSFAVTVSTPQPGGGESNSMQFRLVPTLYYPRLVSRDASSSAADDSEYTGFALTNFSASDASLTITAFDRSGAVLNGPGIDNPAELTIKAGEQLPLVDFQVFGSGLPQTKPDGWFKVENNSGQVSGFFLSFNGSLTTVDGADVSGITMNEIIMPEVEDLGFTRMHLANPGSSPALVQFELRKSDGTLRASSSARTLGPDGALALLLSDLFPGVMLSASDYVRAVSSRGLVSFEYIGKTGSYVEGLNGMDAGGGATTLYSPQYAIGGGSWRTTLSVVNLENYAGNVTFRFVGEDGVQIGNQMNLPIAAKGKLYISDQAFFMDPVGKLYQGYVEVRSDGPRMAGSVVFGDPAGSRFASALPLVSALNTSMVFGQLASSDTWFTGIALLNPNGAAASTNIEVYDQKGALIGSRIESIGPGKRLSGVLTQLFPSLMGQSRSAGYIRVRADRGLAGFALFGTQNLSALAAVPAQSVP